MVGESRDFLNLPPHVWSIFHVSFLRPQACRLPACLKTSKVDRRLVGKRGMGTIVIAVVPPSIHNLYGFLDRQEPVLITVHLAKLAIE